MIEAASRKHGLPSRGRVAGLACALKRCILKSAAVRIGMTILTIGKSQAFVMRGRFSRLGPVTACAGHVLVQPGERETRAGMVEALRRLPSVLIVAAQTLGAQLSGVGILVAVRALLTQPQEGLAQVFDLDFAACGLGYVGGVMTLLATQLGMLSL